MHFVFAIRSRHIAVHTIATHALLQVWAHPLCLVIGFNSENAMHRATTGAVALLGGFFGARAGGIDPALLRPFASGVSVFGTVVLFVAMLIMSSKYALRRLCTCERACVCGKEEGGSSVPKRCVLVCGYYMTVSRFKILQWQVFWEM